MQSQVLDAFFGGRPDLSAPGGIPADVVQAAPPPEKPAEVVPAPPADPAPPAPRKDDLGDVIRRGREEREARRQESRELVTWRERAEAAEAKLAAPGVNAKDDPVGWAVAQGMDEEERSLFARALLYDLVPEKAPAEFRIQLMEARQARREAELENRRVEQERAAQEAAGRQLETQYEETLSLLIEHPDAAVKAPVSHAWFGDDHDSWRASLVATARNMAESARAAGQRADLSPAKVALVLETEMAARAGRLNKGAAVPPPAEPAAKAPASDERVAATSTRGLNGAGAPRPPARNEAEALQRAKDLLMTVPRR